MEYLRTEFIPVEHNYRDDCNQRRIQGGGYGVKPPWTSEIFWFHGVFRPQRVLSPPPGKRKKNLSPLDKFLNTPLVVISSNLPIQRGMPGSIVNPLNIISSNMFKLALQDTGIEKRWWLYSLCILDNLLRVPLLIGHITLLMESYFYTPPVQIQAVDVLRPKSVRKVIFYNLIVVLIQILEKECYSTHLSLETVRRITSRYSKNWRF